eukprot:GHVU01204936.1.p1 GENE.GHVU01204936.1~~GHVU01204936.1.p1  ORF type:complete len:127 (+),score=6.68 GHVU01204936.1:189-569(+)
MTATVDIASTTICLLNAEREKRDYDGSNCHASIRPEAHASKHSMHASIRKRSMHTSIHPYTHTHTRVACIHAYLEASMEAHDMLTYMSTSRTCTQHVKRSDNTLSTLQAARGCAAAQRDARCNFPL